MLKTRMKRWHLGKYSKDGAALTVLQKAKAREDEGKLSAFRYRGKPIDVEEALRHLRRKGFSEEKVTRMIETRANTPSDLSTYTPRGTPSPAADPDDELEMMVIQGSDPTVLESLAGAKRYAVAIDSYADFPDFSPVIFDNFETRCRKNLVDSAQAYYTSKLTSSDWVLATVDFDIHELYPSMRFGGLFNKFVSLRGMQKYEQSFECLNNAFDMIKPLLKIQDPRLLTYLLESINYLKTLGHTELAKCLIQNFSQMSFVVLGRSHPITILTACLYFADADMQPRLIEAALDCIKWNFCRQLGPLHVETMRFTLTASTILKHQRNLTESLTYLEELQSAYELVYGYQSYETCHAIVDKGYLYVHLGLFAEAEEIIGESLVRAHGIDTEYEYVQSVVRCLVGLAALEDTRGDKAKKRAHLRSALAAAEGKLDALHWMVLEAEAKLKEDEDLIVEV